MNSLEKFVHSIFWFSVSLFLNRVKYIIMSIIVSRLGLTNLAIFYISLYLVNEFSSFSNRLISSVYNRYLRDPKVIGGSKQLSQVLASVFQSSLLLSVMGGIIIYLLSYPLAALLHNNQYLRSIQLLSIASPFLIMTEQIMQTLLMMTRFREAVMFHNFVEAFVAIAAAFISVVVFHLDVYSVLQWQVGAIVLSLLLALLLAFILLPRFSFSVILPKPLNLSSIIFFNALFIFLFSHADILLVGFFLGSENLGKYIALLVAPHLIFSLGNIVFKMYLQTADAFREDYVKLKSFTRKVTQYLVITASMFVLFLLLYPTETLNKILFLHINPDLFAIRLLTLAFFLRTIAWIAGQIQIVTKNSGMNMNITILTTLITIVLLAFAIPAYGLRGVAMVLLLSAAAEALVRTFWVYRYSKIYFISRTTLTLFVLGLFYYLLFKFILPLGFTSFLIYFPFLFIIGLIIFGCLDLTDIVVLFKFFYLPKKK